MLFENWLVPRNGNIWLDDDRLGHGMFIRDSDADSFRVG
jgi:hypothetical protein